jgi:hypothetical protein
MNVTSEGTFYRQPYKPYLHLLKEKHLQGPNVLRSDVKHLRKMEAQVNKLITEKLEPKQTDFRVPSTTEETEGDRAMRRRQRPMTCKSRKYTPLFSIEDQTTAKEQAAVSGSKRATTLFSCV